MTVLQRKILLVQFDQIGSKLILVTVNLCLDFFHTECSFLIKMIQKIKGKLQCIFGLFCHFFRSCFTLLDCDPRIYKKTGFQNHKLLILCRNSFLFFRITHSCTGHFYKQITKWKKHNCCNYIKCTVNNCNSSRSGYIINKGKMQKSIQQIEYYHKGNSSDNVEIQMNDCGSFCIFCCTDRRKHCCDTGSNVLSHNNWKSSSIMDCTSHTKCLQNTNRS